MSSSPDPAAEQPPPVSNLTYLHKQQQQQQQQQHSRNKAPDTSQARGRHPLRNERGRRDKQAAKVTRIYPREPPHADGTKSPPSTRRLSSASPPDVPNYHATTSPLLSALGATRTTEWTKSVPFYSHQGSPANGGIAIASSPPTLHNSPGARDGLYAPPMSDSPPGLRPLSHPNQYTTFGGRMQNSPLESPGRDRRLSAYSQHGARMPSQLHGAHQPLPHQPQPHFYGLSGLDLGLNSALGDGMTPGEAGYFCGFDTLVAAGDEAGQAAENVILVGSQGGLDIFRVEKSKMDLVGRLEGLRGAVIGAKVVPWTSKIDPLAASRPLVALTLHGPVVNDSRSSSGSGSSSVVDDSSSESPSRPASRHGEDAVGRISGYQTTIEVYSLKEQRKVATLYKSPLVPLVTPIDSPLFQPPPPVGDFVVDAKGKFIVIASGASGEVFVFAPYLHEHVEFVERYRCLGKLWTSVQQRERVAPSSASSATESSHDDTPPEKYRVPVFSLSDRWLATSPPASSSLYPLNGTALTSPYYERPPGLLHHSVPPQPIPNCAVDAPEAASLIDRLAREGTQVAIEGARWATKKGYQAFKSYMNKGQPINNHMPHSQDPMQHHFPPTHGHNQAQPRQESSVISISDLQKLVEAEETRSKNSLHPVSSIPATLGCSFLSFSPSGLMLLTVSQKGDYQDVWDLKRMNFRRVRKTMREQPAGPHVRQIARFTRMTVTNVIDVSWSTPLTDRLALVTDKSTVHMFSMPASAFQWPPARRIRQAPPLVKSEEATSPTSPVGAVSSAMKAINGTAKPFLDAVRARNTGAGPRFTLSSLGVAPAAGAKSGKAVAAGVGKSINNIRHAGDNKLALPASASGAKPSSVRWLTGRGRGSIALVSGGLLQIWRVQIRSVNSYGKASATASITKRKIVEFGLAAIRASTLPPSIAEQLFPQPNDPEPPQELSGEWLPRSLPPRRPGTGLNLTQSSSPFPAPLSFSEIETSPPYQPFHTDRRVTRFIYARPRPSGTLSSITEDNQMLHAQIQPLTSPLHHQDDTENNSNTPWLFGESVEAHRISPHRSASQALDLDADDDSADDDLGAGVAARVQNTRVLRDNEDEIQRVVVTTRRRRARRAGGGATGTGEMVLGEEGFFEDDCEVLDWAEDRV